MPDRELTFAEAIREALPEMHIHAFSPLEITQGAATLGLSLTEFLTRLKAAGLDSAGLGPDRRRRNL